MIDISGLPKEPVLALESAILQVLGQMSQGNASVEELRMQSHPIYQNLILLGVICRKALPRIKSKELAELIEKRLQFLDSQSLAQVREKLTAAHNDILATRLDNHFLDPVDVESFDEADVPADERHEIRGFLQRARDLAAVASFLSETLKRRFLHKISVAENELFKEKVGLDAFWAIAYEGSRFLRKFGEDAEPLAEAIEKARTKTERHIEGFEQIEADPKPKQITDQSSETAKD